MISYQNEKKRTQLDKTNRMLSVFPYDYKKQNLTKRECLIDNKEKF